MALTEEEYKGLYDPILAEDFINLKNRVKMEMLRRNSNFGSLVEFAGTTYDYEKTPAPGDKVVAEHINKISEPLKQVSYAGLAYQTEGMWIQPVDSLDQALASYEYAPAFGPTHHCASSCSGLCATGCYSSCTNSCFSNCSGSCAVDCTGSCGNNCSGGCFGSCTASCANDCSGGCAVTCTGGCSNSCWGGCTASCADGSSGGGGGCGCGGNCSGSSSGSGGGSSGCTSTCASSCRAYCEGACGTTVMKDSGM